MSELRALRESGKTFREVGDAFNIGPAQARWIYGCCVRRDAWAAEDERRRAEAAPMLAKLDAAGGTIYEKGGVFYTKTEFLATHG